MLEALRGALFGTVNESISYCESCGSVCNADCRQAALRARYFQFIIR